MMVLGIRLLIFGICVLGFLIVLPSIVISKNFFNSDPLELYPNGIEFRIWRDNKVIGTHIVSFTRLKNNKVLVNVKMNLVVRFLNIPVYKYNYHSRAIWLRGQLIRLFATQNDDGEVSNVEVLPSKNALIIKGIESIIRADLGTYPTNHWNSNVVFSKEVINTLTGHLASVSISKIRSENVSIKGGSVLAIQYQYSGDIETTVWYSTIGQWVRMVFKGKDGSNITYECVECGLGNVSQ